MPRLSLALAGTRTLEIPPTSSSLEPVTMSSSTFRVATQPLLGATTTKCAPTLDAALLLRHRRPRSRADALDDLLPDPSPRRRRAAPSRIRGSSHRRSLAPDLTAAYGETRD